jgi:hypothetical protein
VAGPIALIESALAGVAGVYLATRSVPVTIAAGIIALVLASLTVLRRR